MVSGSVSAVTIDLNNEVLSTQDSNYDGNVAITAVNSQFTVDADDELVSIAGSSKGIFARTTENEKTNTVTLNGANLSISTSSEQNSVFGVHSQVAKDITGTNAVVFNFSKDISIKAASKNSYAKGIEASDATGASGSNLVELNSRLGNIRIEVEGTKDTTAGLMSTSVGSVVNLSAEKGSIYVSAKSSSDVGTGLYAQEGNISLEAEQSTTIETVYAALDATKKGTISLNSKEKNTLNGGLLGILADAENVDSDPRGSQVTVQGATNFINASHTGIWASYEGKVKLEATDEVNDVYGGKRALYTENSAAISLTASKNNQLTSSGTAISSIDDSSVSLIAESGGNTVKATDIAIQVLNSASAELSAKSGENNLSNSSTDAEALALSDGDGSSIKLTAKDNTLSSASSIAALAQGYGSIELAATGTNTITGADMAAVADANGTITIGSGAADISGELIAVNNGSVSVTATGGNIDGSVIAVNNGSAVLKLSSTELTGAAVMNNTYENQLPTDDSSTNVLTEAGSKFFLGRQMSADNLSSSGSISVTLTDGAKWYVTDNSVVTDLSVTDSTLDIHNDDDSVYKRVTAGTFTGENAVVKLKHDISSETDTDQLAVTGKASGSVTPVITVTGTAGADQVKGLAWLISQGTGSSLSAASTAQVNTQNGGAQQWKLAFFKEESTDGSNADGANTTGTGNDAGYWYLVKADDPVIPDDPVTPVGPVTPVTPEVKSLLSGAVSLGQATAWAEEIEDLRLRLGEVRDDGKTGAWVRVKGYRERFKTASGFKQHVRGVHVGADSRIKDSGWFAGAAFRYANANQDSVIEGTEGDTHLYSLKGYATKLWENGSYFDAVVQIGRYDHTVTGYANDLQNKYSADYNGWGFGLSAEVGRKFRFGENTDAWYRDTFIEPQAQLSYQQIRGKDFTTSTGMQVSQDNAKFVTGRLGVVAGKEFRHDDGRFFQMNALAGVKRLFKGDQTVSFLGTDGASARIKAVDIAGTRVYYGVSFNWVPKKNIRAYGEFRREQGDSYVKDYEVNLGVRYTF